MVLCSGAESLVLGDLVPGEEEESLILVSSFFIASYCTMVVAVRRALALVNWKRVRPLFVAASTILLRWPSRAWREKSPVGVGAAADAAWNVSVSGVIRAPGVAVAAVMPSMVIAAAVLPKTPPPLPSRALFALERELVGAEGRLPCGPHLVSAG